MTDDHTTGTRVAVDAVVDALYEIVDQETVADAAQRVIDLLKERGYEVEYDGRQA